MLKILFKLLLTFIFNIVVSDVARLFVAIIWNLRVHLHRWQDSRLRERNEVKVLQTHEHSGTEKHRNMEFVVGCVS